MALYLCYRFQIFDISILEEYVSHVEGGPHLFQSCLCAMRDGLPHGAKEMHPSVESLVVIGAPSLHASLMDIHHDKSLKSILEDDSISLASRACICSCSGKGARLWLVVRPSIRSFRITHFTFTLALHFHLNLI